MRMRSVVMTICVAVLLSLVSPQSLAASIYDLFEPLRVSDGEPAWGDLRVGLEKETLEGLISSPLVLSPLGSDLHSYHLYSATIEYRGRTIAVVLDDRANGDLKLSSIMVKRHDTDSSVSWERAVLLRQVKQRLPGLQHKASRHEPDVAESQVDRPMYVLLSAPEVLVRLEPGYSIRIVNTYLLD